EGDVMVPYEQDLTMCHGQGLFVMGIEGCQASPGGTPMDTFEIPDGYTAATFALVLESGQAEGEHLPGAASIEVTDPHGNVYEAGARGTYMVVQGHHLEEPAGTWSHDVAQAGAGFAIVEGVTYTKVEVSLPSGCMLGAVPDGLAGTPCA
ncbi:MAG: hypothetical protein R3185_02650, partial [Candidatus Thermoplasmatota archaeon]|nr:hypothetical protein [Candidatus Thermoplasmatota archaeon]